MGYESRVYVGERFTLGEPKTAFFVKWSMFNLCKMGGDNDGKHFNSCFKTDIDFDLWENDEQIKTDCYGEAVKYCHIDDIIAWFENNDCIKDYMRAQVFLSYLKALKEVKRGTEIVCVHYGY